MTTEPSFAFSGSKIGYIDVRLSYKIVDLFSAGLYTSPNKAVEELVANSFDAGAQRVHVILSPDLNAQGATIVVIDDGHGLDQDGLRHHWLIGDSNKRKLTELPRGRQQIGKFGIGKLSTYVLANRLTHTSKIGTKYYSASMNYHVIDKRGDVEVEPKSPIKIALRELTAEQAKEDVTQWMESAAFKATNMSLFGDDSPESWTVSIMSDLKDRSHEIQPGRLRWILRTALPLRPDFGVWLDGEKLEPSKAGKGLLKKWIIGKDLVNLPRPRLKGITLSLDRDSKEHRFGLNVPGLGRVTGYAEAYKDLLTGKSDDIGRSHGFFVYVRERLINADDGHFGISPNELRHGTFGRFRLVIYMDGLDAGLRSNRESVATGQLLATAQDVLWAIFNVVRNTIEKHDLAEEPGMKLSRKIASSPSSLSREPIVRLSRAVAENRAKSHYLIVPSHMSVDKREQFLADLDQRSLEPTKFVTGMTIDREGTVNDVMARFDTESGILQLNGWHPFIAVFYDEFINKIHGQPLELFAMAEILNEAHLYSIGVRAEKIEEFLQKRDYLLRHLANKSGRQSALFVANRLLDARSDWKLLEEAVCDAFRSLGFGVTDLGKPGEPDGVATANLSVDDDKTPRSYKVSLEAKSKKEPGEKVSAKTVDIPNNALHRDKFNCEHAIVVGPAFPTSKGEESTIGKHIEADRSRTSGKRTMTLITVEDLARLVLLRPIKQIGLRQIRTLFTTCALPEESASWVESISNTPVEKPDYRRIIRTIEEFHKKHREVSMNYSTLLSELSHLSPPIIYKREEELEEICREMAQMTPAIWAHSERVELDQSADNAITDIDGYMQDHLFQMMGI